MKKFIITEEEKKRILNQEKEIIIAIENRKI